GVFGKSTGTLNIFVDKAPTNVAVQATPSGGANYGTSVSFTATVTSSSGGSPPAGVTAGKSIVTFLDTNTHTTLGVADLVAGGTPTINTSALTAGSHTIRATYTDTYDTNFATSFIDFNYVISNAPTSVTVQPPTWSTSPTSPVYAQALTLNARVT